MNRGLSIIEQAPLGGCEAPPSPLSFKLLLVVFWRVVLLFKLLKFRAKHSGVSNPSLGPSYCVFRFFKATFIVYFTLARILQFRHSLALLGLC